MTETSCLAAFSRRVMKRSQRGLSSDQQCANAAKAGISVPGIDAEIVDQDLKPLPHDGKSTGEVLLRRPWVIDGYYGDPRPQSFHNGWLRTGDVARIDTDERVIVSDRAKDLIKSGGEWTSRTRSTQSMASWKPASSASRIRNGTNGPSRWSS